EDSPLSDNPRLTAEDRAQITELMARYSWAMDTNNPESLASLFTPNGVFDGLSGYFEGRDQLMRLPSQSRTRRRKEGLRVQHWVSNSVFDGDGSRCVVNSMSFGPSASDGATVIAFVGYYVDHLVKVDGIRWLFERRRWR